MYFTQTDIANMNIKTHRALTQPEIAGNMIASFRSSKERAEMVDAKKYYSVENTTISNRKMKYYVDGIEYTENGDIRHPSGWEDDKTAANNKLLSAFQRNLVSQKVGYAFKNRPQISSENKEIETVLHDNKVNGPDFHNMIVSVGVNASNDGKSWVHPFFNKENNLEWLVEDAKWCIPIYDNHYQKELTAFIRFYPVTIVDERGDEKSVLKAEWWNERETWYYIQNDQKKFVNDSTEPLNPKPHFLVENTGTKTQQAGAWGRVPFIKIKNNADEISDFRLVRSLIDAYDLSRSDLQNTLEDLQDALLAFTGAEGETAVSLRRNIKTHKIALLAEGQKAESLSVDVPKEAREYHDKQLKDDIYENSQGVHFGSDKWGNSPSGISLKFMFAPLDIKVDMLITEMKKSLNDAFWFVFRFDYIKNRRTVQYDPELVAVKFTKSVMVNDKEQSEIVKNLTGIISQQTQLEQLPFIEDVKEEMKRIKEEKAARQKDIDKQMEKMIEPIEDEPDADESE